MPGVAPVGGRESLEFSETDLPESLSIAGTPAPPCPVSEVVGFRRSTSMVESQLDPPLVLDYQPGTGPNKPGVSFAPLPPPISCETRVTDNSLTTTSNNLSDDLDDWPTNDTGQG